MFKKNFIFLFLLTIGSTFFLHAQTATSTLLQDVEKTYKAEVTEIISTEKKQVPNTGVEETYQVIKVKILSGDKLGRTITIPDVVNKVSIKDKLYIRYLKTSDGTEFWSVSEPYRLDALLWLTILFIAVVIAFGGRHGFLALIAIIISFCGVFFFLFPQLLHGADPIITSLVIAMLSLFVVMFFTHGFNRVTTAAYLGCMVAVTITVFLAKYAVLITKLSGFSDDESVYLNLATGGGLNFQSLLIAAIVIGVIGVVDDVAITQASVVAELQDSNAAHTKLELYRRAMKVGKDHSAALINTLILAYAGASLPLLLLLYTSTTPILELINREAISTEIIRTIVGSVGLVILVPCATAIAVFLVKKGDTSYGHSHASHEHNH